MKKSILSMALLGASFAALAGDLLPGGLREEIADNARRVAPMNTEVEVPARKDAARPGRDDTIGTPVFSLKGLSLKMTQEDFKKIIPVSNYFAEKIVDGKEVGSYSCGKDITRKPGVEPVACNFTLAGVEIHNVVAQFWGDRPVRVSMYFNRYGDPKVDNQGNLALLQDALDAKYPKQASVEHRLGSRDPGEGMWMVKNERIAFDHSVSFSAKMDIIELKNVNLSENMITTFARSEAEREMRERQIRINKAAADL